MNTQNQSGFKTFTATAVALEAFVRVTIDSNGLISVAGESDVGIGVTQEAIAASGTGTVKLWTAPGTFLIQTAAAVAVGAALYAAAAGEVDDTGTYRLPLVAGEIAATAQGDMIECLPNNNLTTIVGNYVAADIGTLAATGADQAGAAAIVKKVTAVTAADGTKGVRLPAAVAGLVYEIGNGVNAILKLYPATSDTINSGSANAAIDVAAYKSARCVAYDATNWIVSFA